MSRLNEITKRTTPKEHKDCTGDFTPTYLPRARWLCNPANLRPAPEVRDANADARCSVPAQRSCIRPARRSTGSSSATFLRVRVFWRRGTSRSSPECIQTQEARNGDVAPRVGSIRRRRHAAKLKRREYWRSLRVKKCSTHSDIV